MSTPADPAQSPDFDLVASNIDTVVRLADQSYKRRTLTARIGMAITGGVGTMASIILHVFFIAGWCLYNSVVIGVGKPFDPYPFNLLTLIVSFEGVLIALFVLLTQNRMARQTELRSHLNLQLEMLMEQELTTTLRLVRRLCEAQGIEEEEQQVSRLSENTDVEKLAETLEERLLWIDFRYGVAIALWLQQQAQLCKFSHRRIPTPMSGTLQTQLANPTTPLENEIAALGPWFHNLHLPDGTQTAPDHPLGDFPSFKWAQLREYVPQDLTGFTVLDIGCNSGFYSFELARRGATVRAIDVEPHYLRQARWAAEIYGLQDRITFEEMPLYDLAREAEQYDIVWFMGVLYHLRYPLLALDIIGRKVRQLMVMQSLTTDDREVITDTTNLGFKDIPRMSQPGWPQMAFVENDLLGDSTNWWLPNEACLQAMLRSAGFTIEAQPALGTFVCRPGDRAFAHQSELNAAVGPQG